MAHHLNFYHKLQIYFSMIYPFLLIASLSLVTGSHDDIIQIHAIFRHGERTPADTYPTDPHKDNDFAPFGWGQLTNNGKRQQYEQGQFLRKKYNEFLGDRLSTNEVEARATGVDRTRMSLMLMMAGLYPPKGDQVWNEQLSWQPVPYSSQELNEDSLLLVRNCPRYQEALNDLLSHDDNVKAKLEEQKELYKYLEEHCGRKVSNPDDVQDIYSTLKAEETFGLELPDWTKSVYPGKMAAVTAYSFQLNAGNKELQKIKAGPMLKKILEESIKKADGKSKKKFLAYAGHDSTVSNLGMALGVWEPQIPVYNIMFILEVHDHDGHPGIKVLLRNSTDHEPFELTIPGCEEVCPIDQMKTILSEVLPTEGKESICAAKDATYKPPAEGGP